VASMILAMDSVDGQRGRPSADCRLDLLKAVESSPARLASAEADREWCAARASIAAQTRSCESIPLSRKGKYAFPVLRGESRLVQKPTTAAARDSGGRRAPCSDSGGLSILRVHIWIKALIKGLSFLSHVDEQLGGLELRSIFLLQALGGGDEFRRTYAVDIGQRPAAVGRKAESQDRADIRLPRIGDNSFLHHARGFQRDHE